MSFNKIDEILKKGFRESERQNEHLADLSKERIWNAIEKPKKQLSLHWVFVTAIAASVSLFLISIFLFYKLDLKQNEIDALHAEELKGIPLIESTDNIPFKDEKASINLIIEREELPELISTGKNSKFPPLDDNNNLEKLNLEKFNNRRLIAVPVNETSVLDFKTEMTISDFEPPVLKKLQFIATPTEYTISPEAKSKKHGKMRIRIGNGSTAHSSHHSLALHFKL